MPYACPHCTKAIDDVVPKDRIDAKNQEILLLKTSNTELTTQVAGHAGVAQELAKLKSTNAELEQTNILTGAGVAADKHKGFRVLYDSAIAGVESPPTFGDWMKDTENGAPAHPLLKDSFGKVDPGAGGGAGGAGEGGTGGEGGEGGADKTKQLPNGEGGATKTPPNQGKMNTAQLRAYFQTPEYKALSAEDKRAKLKELESAT